MDMDMELILKNLKRKHGGNLVRLLFLKKRSSG